MLNTRLLLPLALLNSCQFSPSFPTDNTLFEKGVSQGVLENPAIEEASGIVSSRLNPQRLWTHNDHGDRNRLFLLDEHGRNFGTFYLAGAENRDWEDIATASLNGVQYLYVGDTGDNDTKHDLKIVYRVKEPRVLQALRDTTLSEVETIRIAYPDKNRDAEALLVDQHTNDLYIVSKYESRVVVYQIPYPQSTQAVNTAKVLFTLPLTIITGGDIAPDNSEILLKSYREIYYWKRHPGESIAAALQRDPVTLPYDAEPHGEAIAFAADGSGYFTLSETKRHKPARVYFYRRIQ